MTTDEQARVLRMVADGKLTAEQGAALLDALQPEPVAVSPTPHVPEAPFVSVRPVPSGPAPARSLVIQITEDGESRVNVRIPLGLARAATKFIPRQAHEYLEKYEIDLADLLAGVGNGLHGPLIEVQDDEDTVRIAVE